MRLPGMGPEDLPGLGSGRSRRDWIWSDTGGRFREIRAWRKTEAKLLAAIEARVVRMAGGEEPAVYVP